jgi:serine-protein kinase ATM
VADKGTPKVRSPYFMNVLMFIVFYRYNKGDIPPHEFYNKMIDVRKDNKDPTTLTSTLITHFLSLRKRFKPVMRQFFTEKHKMPMSWFAMRLNYTRSVATTSIVGHILGLGDRHTSNILLDSSTGEVVHIDLGIAFEQVSFRSVLPFSAIVSYGLPHKGKLLPVPECVPFRMTADMVDGMGTTGTQGVFQRCAEETLRVLRNDSEVVLTVLEVFKYDPLHSWCVYHRSPRPNDSSPRFLPISLPWTVLTQRRRAGRRVSSR